MNKFIKLIASITCMIIFLVGCGQTASPSKNELVSQSVTTINGGEVIDNWGIQLNATKITSAGLTLICNQSGGEPTGDLYTGSYYILEEKLENQWVPVEMLPSEYERGWTDEAWIVPMNDTIEWEVNWEEIYGELPGGNYRIGKEITDLRSSGDYDTKIYYAYFEIKN